MNDPFGVRGVQCVGNLDSQVQQCLQFHRLRANAMLQGYPIQKLHGNERTTITLAARRLVICFAQAWQPYNQFQKNACDVFQCLIEGSWIIKIDKARCSELICKLLPDSLPFSTLPKMRRRRLNPRPVISDSLLITGATSSGSAASRKPPWCALSDLLSSFCPPASAMET